MPELLPKKKWDEAASREQRLREKPWDDFVSRTRKSWFVRVRYEISQLGKPDTGDWDMWILDHLVDCGEPGDLFMRMVRKVASKSRHRNRAARDEARKEVIHRTTYLRQQGILKLYKRKWIHPTLSPLPPATHVELPEGYHENFERWTAVLSARVVEMEKRFSVVLPDGTTPLPVHFEIPFLPEPEI